MPYHLATPAVFLVLQRVDFTLRLAKGQAFIDLVAQRDRINYSIPMSRFVSVTMGLFRLGISMIWAGLAMVGMYVGDQVLTDAQGWLDNSMTPVVKSLNIVQELLFELGDVLAETQEALITVQDTTVNLTLTLTDTYPLIDETSQIITQDLPLALEGVQSSMPSVIETAAAVDETLTFLSGVQITIPNLFGDNLEIGLGINYSPDVPLDQALEELMGNLEGIPADLRTMENDLDKAASNMMTLRDDLSVLADDLHATNQQLAELSPQVQEFAENVGVIQKEMEENQAILAALLPTLRLGMIIFLSLILLGQVPSAYVGIKLLREE
jgi:prefoldin subunit 5